MRFTDGIWRSARGMRIHAGESLWEYEVTKKEICAFVPCTAIKDLNDTTYGPALTILFSAPRENVIKVHVNHYSGTDNKGPQFSLYETDFNPIFEELEETVSMISGKLKVVINKKDVFGFDFYYDGKKMVSSGERTLAYITDIDYEANQCCDYNHLPPRPYYMKETYMREQLSLGVGETIYGLGERFTAFVKNGQSIEMWNKDGGTFGEQSYKNIPFYLSSKGYGVLVNHSEHIAFEVATENVRKVQFSVEGQDLEYLVIGGGNPKTVLSNYTLLTGRSPVPPAWTFGLWLSTSWTPSYDEKTVLSFLDELKRYDIPLSVFHYDAGWMKPFELCNFKWDEKFGNPKVMLDKVKKCGIKICVWINPYIGQRSRLYEEGKREGYLLKRKDGEIWQADDWMPGQTIVDFTNPQACKWYAKRLGEVLDTGVDCLKTDFAERIPTEVEWFDGSNPQKMHNYYTYLYNETVYNLLKEKKGEREACVFARSATVGTQKFPVNWGGDNLASYESMAESLRGGLSFCQSGFGFWAHDISGFESTATPDLYKRWSAFGLLSTHSRLHGHDSYRVPWNFGEEACQVLSFFSKLKCSLMPYLFSKAVEVEKEGIPEMRAMILEFPEDANCLYLDRQYMLGDGLLIAPIFSEEGQVQYYVPDGVWTNYLTGEQINGGQWHCGKFDYYSLPLLVRPNTILPEGGVNNRADYEYCNDITLHLYELEEQTLSTVKLYEHNLQNEVTITALKEGRCITVILDAEINCKIRLHNIVDAVCSECSILKAENDIVLIPNFPQKNYHILLE